MIKQQNFSLIWRKIQNYKCFQVDVGLKVKIADGAWTHHQPLEAEFVLRVL